MKCPSCGKEIENDMTFCYHCGEAITISVVQNEDALEENNTLEPVDDTSTDNKLEKDVDGAEVTIFKLISFFILGVYIIVEIVLIAKFAINFFFPWGDFVAAVFNIVGFCLVSKTINSIVYLANKDFLEKSDYEKNLRRKLCIRQIVCDVLKIAVTFFWYKATKTQIYSDYVDAGCCLAFLYVFCLPIDFVSRLWKKKPGKLLKAYLAELDTDNNR